MVLSFKIEEMNSLTNQVKLYWRRWIKSFCQGLYALAAGFFLFPSGTYAQDADALHQVDFQVPHLISQYKVSAAENLLLPGHLYSKSAGTSVGINQTHLGTGNIISPPFFCYPFSSLFTLFHQQVPVTDYNWYPAGTILQGKAINGVSSKLTITPLWDSRGVLAQITLHNTLDHQINVPAQWQIDGRIGKSDNWEWHPPFAMKSNPGDIRIKSNHETIVFYNDSTWTLIKSHGFKINPDKPNSLERQIALQPNEKKSFSMVILIGTELNFLTKTADQLLTNPGKLGVEAFFAYNRLLENLESKVPTLAGGSSDLHAFYKKGLLTFSTCRWEVPEFITSPWYAESGIDGGALNNYCWGVVYVSRLMSMIDPAGVRKLLVAYVASDLQKTYALNPATGFGMGVLYSYNYYSIARATYDYITITGDLGILNEKIGQETYLETIYNFCLSREDLHADPELIDYGANHNMLELKRTTDYCNYTPSPNAERLLIYRYLTDFFCWMGKTSPNDLSARGEKLIGVFQSKLWDAENKWLYSLNSEHQPTTAYSIQIFDVLRTGALTNVQQEAIVSHLNTREFLSNWGVHSLAKTDEGYDSTDIDWGGPGVYAGDAPELMEDLLHAGFADQGIDLLHRIFWWGKFPYYPQAFRADRIGYREDGRPNEIAGLAAPQSILFGLFGITVGKDFISLKPVNHPTLKGLSLTNLMIRTKKINISIHKDKSEFSVVVGRKKYKSSLGKEIIIKLPDLTSKGLEGK